MKEKDKKSKEDIDKEYGENYDNFSQYHNLRQSALQTIFMYFPGQELDDTLKNAEKVFDFYTK